MPHAGLLSGLLVPSGKEPGLRCGVPLSEERLTMKVWTHCKKPLKISKKICSKGLHHYFISNFAQGLFGPLALNNEDSGPCYSCHALLTDFVLVVIYPDCLSS